jgi:hypothetical protein
MQDALNSLDAPDPLDRNVLARRLGARSLPRTKSLPISSAPDVAPLKTTQTIKETSVTTDTKKPWRLDVDWDKEREAREGGESVASIAKRLGCDPGSVYSHTKGARKKAKPGKTIASNSHKPSAAKNGSAIGAAILELESKRAEIDQAIQTLRRLEA